MNDTTPPDLDFAARIRAARLNNKMSQVIASARSGVSLGTIRIAERYGAATTRTLNALARVYGISVDVLRGRSGAVPAERKVRALG